MAAKKTATADQDLFADAATVPADDQPGADLPTSGFSIDFGRVETVQRPVPKGRYDAQIVHAEGKYAKSSGRPMISLRWKLEGGEYDGRTIFDNLVFTEPTGDWGRDFPRRKIRQCLEAVGFASNFSGTIDPESLIGERATIELDVRAIARDGTTINPETGEAYGEQNNVVAYLLPGNARRADSLL